MRRLLCALSLILVLTGTAAAGHRVGLLSKLNMSRSEFQTYMDAAKEKGDWTLFTTGEKEPVTFVFFDSLTAMLLGLNAGQVDEINLPDAVGEYLINVNPGYTVACITMSNPAYFAFGFRKSDDPELKDRFNEALMGMKADGTLAILQAKYIAEPGVDEPEPVNFWAHSGADTIKVAVTGDLPPIDFVLADGRPAGFNTAVLAEIGKRLRLNIELLNIDSGARAEALASGRADVIFWVQVYKGSDSQPDVPENIVLSESYFDWNKYLHIRKK